MAIVISDLHGNKLKCDAFLKHKPEEEHIIIGDFFDSYHASDEDIIETLKLAIDANATLLVGNHEFNYINNAHGYFICSGKRDNPIFSHYFNTHKDKFFASIIRDDFLICHGGLSKKHGKMFDDLETANYFINDEYFKYVNSPVVPQTLSWIFDIGGIRGGRQDTSGVFWLTFGYEKYDKRFNQIVGHTPSEDIRMIDNYKKNHYDSIHVCVDSPKYHCFNTVTREIEDFMLDDYKDKDQMRRMIERKF